MYVFTREYRIHKSKTIVQNKRPVILQDYKFQEKLKKVPDQRKQKRYNRELQSIMVPWTKNTNIYKEHCWENE